MTGAQMDLLNVADAICRAYPASVTSWWRSARHNASLPGSVTNSQHQQGLAIDLKFDGVQPSPAALKADPRVRLYITPSMQFVTSEPGHLHLEQDPRLLARYQPPAVATGGASAISSPSSSVPPSAPTSSSSSSALASTSAPGAVADSRGFPRAGPGSSPIDALFRRR
jgi:hypothetical protein